MPDNCSVYGCNNRFSNRNRFNIKFHRFPKEKQYRDQWVYACGREDRINTDNALICSIHFKAQDYKDDFKSRLLGIETPKNRRLLKKDAVPCLFLPNAKQETDEIKSGPKTRKRLIQENPTLEPSKENEIESKKQKSASSSIWSTTKKTTKPGADCIQPKKKGQGKSKSLQRQDDADSKIQSEEEQQEPSSKSTDTSTYNVEEVFITDDLVFDKTQVESEPSTSATKDVLAFDKVNTPESISKKKDLHSPRKKKLKDNAGKKKIKNELAVENMDWEEQYAVDTEPFQEIKIEEEDPLNEPYLLGEEDVAFEDPQESYEDNVKHEYFPWRDKLEQVKFSNAIADEGFSQGKCDSKQPKTNVIAPPKTDVFETEEEIIELKTSSQKDKRQKKSSPEPGSKKRYRKILREVSDQEPLEFSQHFTKDAYDLFGLHVAKTLRDINNLEAFNRIKIKILDILLDALAGFYSNPGFDKKCSVGTQFPPLEDETPESAKEIKEPSKQLKKTKLLDDSSSQTMPMDFQNEPIKRSENPIRSKDIHKPPMLDVSSGINENVRSSFSRQSSVSQPPVIPAIVQSIGPQSILPTTPFVIGVSQTSAVDSVKDVSQPSEIPKTSRIANQPAVSLDKASSSESTKAYFDDPSDTIFQDSGTTEASPVADVFETIPTASDEDNIQTKHLVSSSAISPTVQKSLDVTQNTSVDPYGLISQHYEIPDIAQSKPRLPQSRGKRKKQDTTEDSVDSKQ